MKSLVGKSVRTPRFKLLWTGATARHMLSNPCILEVTKLNLQMLKNC